MYEKTQKRFMQNLIRETVITVLGTAPITIPILLSILCGLIFHIMGW